MTGSSGKNDLTYAGTGANMLPGQTPAFLDKRICAQPSVQAPRIITTDNGCQVTLIFSEEQDPRTRHGIASMLLDAFRHQKEYEYETSIMPVQSLDQGSGR